MDRKPPGAKMREGVSMLSYLALGVVASWCVDVTCTWVRSEDSVLSTGARDNPSSRKSQKSGVRYLPHQGELVNSRLFQESYLI
jgi:hypothetical protein